MNGSVPQAAAEWQVRNVSRYKDGA